jgi:hypothetical protein
MRDEDERFLFLILDTQKDQKVCALCSLATFF